MLRVDEAPDAAGFARRETNRVARSIPSFAHPVDPAEAERFVERLRIGQARFARRFIIKAEEQLRRIRMVPFQPGAKLARCGEKSRLHRIWGHEVRAARSLATAFARAAGRATSVPGFSRRSNAASTRSETTRSVDRICRRR